MPNLVNRMILRVLDAGIAKAQGMLLLDVAGMTVKETEGLRRELATKNLRLRLVRNRLVRLSLRNRGIELPETAFKGNLALIAGTSEDAISAAKILKASTLLKDKKLAVRAGMLEGAALSAADALGLAGVPDRLTLQAQLLGLISGPARMLATVLQANNSGLARVMQARSDQLGSAGDSSAASAEKPAAAADGTSASADGAAPAAS
jgi:large subunit ribosomal protein L10